MDLNRWWPALLRDHTQVRDRLVAAYDDPMRGYHDLTHLHEVLSRLDELVPADHPDRDALLLAAWFHDAVYESAPSGGDGNEERSAVLAERELATVDAPPLLIEEVTRLVRLTASHRPAAQDENGHLLCDADLAILAADPDRYAAYTAGVRREYAAVPDAAFRAGRRAVLVDLLAKDRLFGTPAAHDRWEERARGNVSAEISRLEQEPKRPAEPS